MRLRVTAVLLTALLVGCAGPRRAAAAATSEVGTVATGGAALDLHARDLALGQAADVYARTCAQVLTVMLAETDSVLPGVDGRPCSDPALGGSALPAPDSVRSSVIHLSGTQYTVSVTDQAGRVHTRSAP